MHRFERWTLALLVAATLAAGSFVTPSMVSASTVAQSRATVSDLPSAPVSWAERTFSPGAEALLAALVNEARAAAGLDGLRVDPTLRAIARSRSRDMAERHYFSHIIPPTGITVMDVLRADGVSYSWAGEDIGWNMDAAPSAAGTIEQAFLGSTPHRDNILGPHYTLMGVGAYRGPDARNYFTVLFIRGTTTPHPLAASIRVASRVITGTRIAVWATVSGGRAPYRTGWYLGAERLGSATRLALTAGAPGTYTVRFVVIDAGGAVVRRSATMAVLPHP